MNTYWITGLSGAGKTTLAKEIEKQLTQSGEKTILLDGDTLRAILGRESRNANNHNKATRLELAKTYGRLCKYLCSQNLNVVIATISMFNEVYHWNKTNIPGYFEVFIDADGEELRKRDHKGIYRQFDEGKLKDVAGEDLMVDKPNSADIVIKSSSRDDVPITAKLIIQKAKQKLHGKN